MDFLTLHQSHSTMAAKLGWRSQRWERVKRGKSLSLLEPRRVRNQALETMNLLPELFRTTAEVTGIRRSRRCFFAEFQNCLRET